jgi:outer membrane protein with beta-barrel domain
MPPIRHVTLLRLALAGCVLAWAAAAECQTIRPASKTAPAEGSDRQAEAPAEAVDSDAPDLEAMLRNPQFPNPQPAVAGPIYQPGPPNLQSGEGNWVGPDTVDLNMSAEPGGPRSWFSGLVHQWLPPSDGRSRGIGGPLQRESWLNRPYSLGGFTGGLFSDNPIPGQVNGTPGYLAGFRLGWDVEHFWGTEVRFGFSTFGLRNAQTDFTLPKMEAFYMDTNLLFYPWGDTRWRPFASVGMGLADFQFSNIQDRQIHQTTLGMPFGGGLKYRHNNRWVFRVDLLDNLSFQSGQNVATMHNISLTAGLEARFGIGPRRSYWPWNPTRSYR